MKVKLIKDYKMNGIVKPAGMVLTVTPAFAKKLIKDGYVADPEANKKDNTNSKK